MHPGGEHGEDAPGIKNWNVDPKHRRKYIATTGRLVDVNDSTREAELSFWGEWEPPSQVTRLHATTPDGPCFVHRPLAPQQLPVVRRQNTDPWVFGDCFRFTLCQQMTRRGPTQLRFLDRGSVMLFGSCLSQNRFVLDTCFVVGSFAEVNARSYDTVRSRLDAAYDLATFSLLEGMIGSGGSLRLYEGATPENPVAGMYSFFPARITAGAPDGFPRPVITRPDLITPNLTQGKRLNPQPSLEDAAERWRDVVAQVRKQGNSLGVRADAPTFDRSLVRQPSASVESFRLDC
jgi:hypothetical protein